MSRLPIELLQREFLRRRAKNQAYSLRSFARVLGLPSGRLSEILSGKRRISAKVWERVGARMKLSEDEFNRGIAEILLQRNTKGNAQGNIHTLEDHGNEHDDIFRVIADRAHYTLLSLLKVRGFKYDIRWIAQKMNASVVEVREIVARLIRLKLIHEVNGKLKRIDSALRTSDGATSRAIRLSHKASLKEAMEALDNLPTEVRNVSSVTLAIDAERLPEAAEMIKKFRRMFSSRMERHGNFDQVYELTISFIPLTGRNQ